MTFHHFVNCFALAYAPYYLTYKYSGLYDYRAIWKCVQAGLFYILTQLIKMLILATFFPSADISESSSALEKLHKKKLVFLTEMLRNTLDLIDFGGVYYVLNRIPGKGPGKVLVTGVGWGAAELFLNRFVLLWVGARGMEFDWKYLQLSFDANLSLVNIIVSHPFQLLSSNHDEFYYIKHQVKPLTAVLRIICSFHSLVSFFRLYTSSYMSWSAFMWRSVSSMQSLPQWAIWASSLGLDNCGHRSWTTAIQANMTCLGPRDFLSHRELRRLS
nr:EOG090X0CTK [Artemia franciscana]